ncbi:aminoglycoside phosphotransferase family protein [Paenibacillus cymbidii]|uniref:aminoglycoside phosphotransferase family protein n=1 Tax=Paenibacillus cymbidii TaxID=1639034 RepID=UPI001F32CA09|nr:aminoglycoside phosphotransferase family protein [Paenibacillus cymbidii]
MGEIVQFGKLCEYLRLGEIVEGPVAVSGGFMHRMYALQTTLGRYAVKALNPEIMRRPTAMRNFIDSERIANVAARYVPALPAKVFNGDSIHKVDEQYYLVFDWIDGEVLRPSEIDTVHCEKIGGILSDLHKIDFAEPAIANHWTNDSRPTNWQHYLEKGQESQSEWANLLLEIIDKLNEWNVTAIESTKRLSAEWVISHGDLDPKNVMWHQHTPALIDWESAGYRNPKQDLLETAIYWSENELGKIDKEKFFAFMAGYRKSRAPLQANWSMILASGFLGKLDWLEYNLKRSLWIECTDEAEQSMGTSQAIATIHSITRYADTILELEAWLNAEEA